ncbi:MAG: SRPBCC domain-containing protein [Bacteroidetes bacterium]|nr:SRPBCC domain-containing protein [Bacteroidota bacterium]
MKTKYELEYTLNTSPSILFNRISTPEGLSEWFADDVNLKKDLYTFIWEGTEQEASVVQKKNNKYIRFHWEEDDEEIFFEFRIHTDELTGDVALLITDFAEEGEKGDAVDLWDTQISELKHAIGL